MQLCITFFFFSTQLVVVEVEKCKKKKKLVYFQFILIPRGKEYEILYYFQTLETCYGKNVNWKYTRDTAQKSRTDTFFENVFLNRRV